ncbi:MAG: hypothetical protein IJE73_04135 [Muribaculaceae bacterium]|nr:hypothetical protein [Muribaculaceae bacterium]
MLSHYEMLPLAEKEIENIFQKKENPTKLNYNLVQISDVENGGLFECNGVKFAITRRRKVYEKSGRDRDRCYIKFPNKKVSYFDSITKLKERMKSNCNL